MKTTLPELDDIGVELSHVDARDLDAAAVEEIQTLVYHHKLVVFRNQELSNREYIDLAAKLGRPQIYFQPNYLHPEHPEIFVSSNLPRNGRKFGVAGTGRYWHTDYQFFDEPLPLTFVYPQRLPAVNRETYYIDMERVLRGLPEHLRRHVEGTRAVHEAKWRYKVQAEDIDKSITEILEEFGALTPAVTHPTVIVHPVTGARLLYVSEGFTVGLEGYSYEEGRAILRELFEFIQREEHVHVHGWREGDILLWDNRQVIHKASTVPRGEPSVSYRIGVYDGLPFYTNA